MAISGGVESLQSDTRPSVDPLQDPPGFRINDPIERRFFDVYTPSPVEPAPVRADPFSAPIDRTVRVETAELRLEQFCAGFIRADTGAVVQELEQYARSVHDRGTYTIELTAPVKVMIRVTGPLTVETGFSQMRFDFEERTEVLVGIRSYHRRPEATITTTGDPADLMQTVSAFGSALKTVSCERSYPTLRGHPPGVKLGETLDIPEAIAAPETGLRIEVPRDIGSVFVVAPLAYYLGATVVPGSIPRIVADTGFEHPLTGARSFEDEVERVLKQTFLLDCITRTEGEYPIDLQERSELEPHVGLDFEALYDASPGAQLEAYLSVPYDRLADSIPTWKLASHVTPEPANAEVLPFLVDDLALIRRPRSSPVSRADAQTAALDDFMRRVPTRSAATRRSSTTASRTSVRPDLIQPEDLDSIEQAWVGPDAPVGASKTVIEAFRNRLDRTDIDDDVDITVICNDESMLEEQEIARGIYGSREALPFDVTMYGQLDTERLRLVLESDIDFLHYIGHVDEGGIECPDGRLDVADLDRVGVDSFFLNACRSYNQGLALIERGAIGGVVTLDDVLDSGALRVGETLVRLLNLGFPLRPALEIARDRSIVGGQYLVVGDGNVDIAHAESMTPTMCNIRQEADEYTLTIETFPARNSGMGTVFFPSVVEDDRGYLSSGQIGPFAVDRADLEMFLEAEARPIRIDGTFTWSDTVDLDAY